MRSRIWYCLQDKKFQAVYTAKLSKRAGKYGNRYSLFLALASAGSVAAWSIWTIIPYVWSSIVVIAQILHIAKPYVGVIKHDREYMEMSLLYEGLYLSYEKLWYDHKNSKHSESYFEKQLEEYQRKSLDLADRFKNTPCPEVPKIMNQSSEETEKFLQRFYT